MDIQRSLEHRLEKSGLTAALQLIQTPCIPLSALDKLIDDPNVGAEPWPLLNNLFHISNVS